MTAPAAAAETDYTVPVTARFTVQRWTRDATRPWVVMDNAWTTPKPASFGEARYTSEELARAACRRRNKRNGWGDGIVKLGPSRFKVRLVSQSGETVDKVFTRLWEAEACRDGFVKGRNIIKSANS